MRNGNLFLQLIHFTQNITSHMVPLEEFPDATSLIDPFLDNKNMGLI